MKPIDNLMEHWQALQLHIGKIETASMENISTRVITLSIMRESFDQVIKDFYRSQSN